MQEDPVKETEQKNCGAGLTPDLKDALIRTYGDRGKKALKAVEEKRVKKYCDFFVVVGYSDEYVVDEDFCTCGDFLYRGRECIHIIAVRTALITGCYERYDSWYYPSLLG
ncbi:MAG: SWIM zinc finger family protein [Methanomicrobiales archaeon]|nr:SWIM zinc finger family protein [Methanomicrobiales archaeon]